MEDNTHEFSNTGNAFEAWTPERSDAAVQLEDQILDLAGEIEAAIHRLLLLLARFDALRGWELGGFSSCAHWLAARAGIDLGAAREKVRTARGLEALPLTSAALSQGRITYSQARALTRVATADDEDLLLDEAEGRTTAQVERLVRGWRLARAEDEAEREEERQRSRCFSVVPDLDGMYRVHGRLTPEQGAMLMRAIDQMGDLLFRESQPGSAYETPKALEAMEQRLGRSKEASSAAASRRRADALALLAERAMRGCGEMMHEAEGVAENESADVASDVPISGSAAERYQVLLYVDMEALEARDARTEHDAGSEQDAREQDARVVRRRSLRSMLEDNVRVSQETSRRRCCDAAVVPVATDGSGHILNLGHRVRTVNPSLRRALEARDRGCRFPGCGKRYTEAHHIKHWADGGETSLTNCVLLCRHHHRLVHEGGWRLHSGSRGEAIFMDPRGHMHADGRWAVRRDLRQKAEHDMQNDARDIPDDRPNDRPDDRPSDGPESGPPSPHVRESQPVYGRGVTHELRRTRVDASFRSTVAV